MWTSEQEVPVADIKQGMYIARLDCAWEQTNFPIQGFLIKSPDDIERVKRFCNKVYIDVYKSYSESYDKLKTLTPQCKTGKIDIKNWAHGVEKFFSRYATEKYSSTSTLKKEIPRAQKILSHLDWEVDHLLTSGGYVNNFNLKKLADSASDLTASIIRNPDAMTWMSRIQKNNSLVYRHVLRLAILCCLVGRQFGLNRFLLVDLTMSMLLTGIGKSMVKMETLKQYRFDSIPQEYPNHLKYTLERIGSCDIPGLESTDIVANYCERLDGSGYPLGKKGNEIPLLAQIAGLIEYFEIQVNPFESAQAKSPSDAITQINAVKNSLFHGALVEKFVQAIGIYPTGTLVELNDDRIGIVCSQSYEKRLRASVIPLTNRRGEIVESFKIVDLSLPNQWQLSDSKLRIRKGLPIDSLPGKVIADAHTWLFDKNFGTWGKVKNLMHDSIR